LRNIPLADPRETVERLRTYIQSGAVSASPEVLAAANEYVGLCSDINERLNRCGEFLRDGLAGEAVAHAEARPPVLDRIAVLEFREAAEWERICNARGLPKAPRLAMDVAKRVSDAAARSQPLLDLLARHRYLALAGAPLAVRLQTIRQLHLADPQNAGWKSDLEEYEAARLPGLDHEVKAAIKAENLEAIERLEAEVAGIRWLTPLPVDLLDNLLKAATSLRHALAVTRLQALIPEVRQALASQSYDHCKFVFAKWGTVVRTARIRVPTELIQEILPLGRLIDQRDIAIEQEREFRTACDDLTFAADHNASLDQLTRLHQVISQLGREIPDDVMQVYRRAARIAREQQTDERFKQFVLSAVLVIIIAGALGGLAYVMFWMSKS
jgi:hypothetical protein